MCRPGPEGLGVSRSGERPGGVGPVHTWHSVCKAGNPSSGFQHHRYFPLSLLIVFIVIVCSRFKFVSSNLNLKIHRRTKHQIALDEALSTDSKQYLSKCHWHFKIFLQNWY